VKRIGCIDVMEYSPVVFGFWVMGDWLIVYQVLEGTCHLQR
jgi:hypothetical protein